MPSLARRLKGGRVNRNLGRIIMRGRLRVIWVALATAISAAALVGSAQAANGVTRIVVPFTDSFTNDCNGDLMHFEGDQQLIFLPAETNGFHSNFMHVTAVGSSGTRYVANEHNASVTTFGGNDQQQATMSAAVAFISTDSTSNFVFRLTFHVTNTPTGEHIEILNVTTECIGPS
jgi:hypothetical protein